MASIRPQSDEFPSLIDLLQARVARGGDHGFRFQAGRDDREDRLSLADLDRRARAVASILVERCSRGERALLCYPPGVEFLVGLFGSLYAGMVAVPAYPPRRHKPDGRLAGIVSSCRPGVVLAPASLVGDCDAFAAQNPSIGGIPWLASDGVPDDRADAWVAPGVRPADLAIFQYTSGSTGDPKGVMLSHACVLHNIRAIARSMDLRRDNVGVCWLPAFHDMGLIGNLLGSVYFPGTMTLLSPLTMMQDPFRWLEAVSRTRADISGGPCFAYDLCVQRITDEQIGRLDLSHWRVAYTGAEPISPRILEAFAGRFAACGFRARALYPCYGLAESSLMVTGVASGSGARVVNFDGDALATGRAVTDPTGRATVSCGVPVIDLDVRVVDAETRESLPEGRVGEVWVAGPSVAMGYFERPEATEATFGATLAGGSAHFLRTGDLGFLHEGELYIAGRLKDVLIIRGRNYYPQDIEEAALLSSPLLRAAGAAAFTPENDESRLVLVAEVHRSYAVGRPELFDTLRARIAEDFGLELSDLVLIRTATLPRTSSGKVARRETRQRHSDGTLEVVERFTVVEEAPAAAPRVDAADLREWLTRRLATQLGLAPGQIDADRPFASFGLDSVAMVAIATDLERHLGRRLSPTVLYSAPTVAGLVRLLTENEVAPPRVTAPQEDRRIAILGIGCRLPGADGVDAFWDLLCAGRFAVRDLPGARRADCRRETTAKAGYLDEVRSFDAAFFAVTGREAACLDPQHRLLLEVAYHAIEDAALPADRLAGSRTGAFVGISGNDYGRLLFDHAGPDAYLGIGNATSMAAHRLSFHFDLRGPSLAVDTACSSSLSAVHLACQSLLAGDCDLALAGGVNLILTPDVTESLTRAKMLSPNARCKTFDAAADGYVRGEGCGVVVLKPLAAALRDGDPIRAVIEATATNQDGRSNGITAPNGAAQADLMRRALALAGRSPGDIGAVETHGTGTALGDPIEFDALANALGASTSPCALGAVKTNLGHLEAAAGVAGLIKSALQLERGTLAPVLHLDEVNPLIRLAESRFFVPTAPTEWPASSPRVAGVSSFGFGGTNVHALLSAAPEVVTTPVDAGVRHLLPLSARNGVALQAVARTMADFLRGRPALSVADVARTLGTGRVHMPYRLVVQGADAGEVAGQLERWLTSGRSPSVQAGKAFDEPPCRVGFLFTGQGAAYAGMARRLDETRPAFRFALDRCEQILRRRVGFSLREVLSDPTRIEETEYAQPALFAFGYALAELWRSWGVRPAALLGHSVGEYVAATQAGVFSLEDGLTLIAERGRLMQACPAGAMLACFAAADQVNPALENHPTVCLAADNGPRQCVVAGDADGIAGVAAELARRGIDSRPLPVNKAFHSALIEPALVGLRAAAKKAVAHAPAVPLVSNLTGGFHTDAPPPGYWVEHARSPVRFEANIRAMRRAGVTHFVEIGPAAVLTRLGPACLDGTDTAWLPSQHAEGEGTEILRSLARLHVDGAKLAWERIISEGRRISLPGYGFQRRPYWVSDLPAGSRAPTVEVAAPPAFVPRSAWAQAIERPAAAFGDIGGLVAGVVDESWADHPLDAAVRLRPDFDRLAGLYVASALDQLGWRPVRGEAVEKTGLALRLNLPARQERLLSRVLALAAEDGWLTWDGTRGVVRSAPPGDDPHAAHSALMAKYPEFDIELRLADHCARHLAGVLTGEVDPLQVLFGTEAGTLTEDMYAKSPVSRFYNDLLTKAVRRLLAALPVGRPVRILELGAGTGGTTQALLPILPATRCEYVFTDVSSLFLAKAREKFAAYPWIEPRVLDLEQDLASQGFADGQFDLIIAANVLHATADLRQSVRGARRLLGPGGVLVLLEGTGPRRLLDLIFGLTEGWWRFRDADVRPDYPLISPDAWTKLLGEEGFAGTLALPDGDERLPDPDQVVLLASANAPLPCPSRPVVRPSGWLVCGAESPLFEATVARLRAEGQSVVASRPEVFDAVRTQLNGSAPSRVVFLPGSVRMPGDAAEQVWLVSCGAADLHSGDWGAGVAGNERAVDLDPSLGGSAQGAQLVESLLRGDDYPAVVFRGGQRYVRPSAPRAEPRPARESAPVAAPDRAALLAASPAERRGLVDRYLRQELALLLGSPLSDDDMDLSVQSLGLDSLMAIQVRNRVESGLGVALSLVDFLKGLRVRQLVDNIVKQLPQSAPRFAPKPARREEAVSVAASEVRSMSETEVDSLLASLLDDPASN